MKLDNVPSLGVCVLTFNSELTIGYVLKYLLIQDYPKDKVFYLIVDGGSSDNTIKVIHDVSMNYLDSKIEVLVAEGTNIPQARNLCLEKLLQVGVDYILFVDSDTVVTATNAFRIITQLSKENNTLLHFASSYRYFKDVDDFRAFIKELQLKETTLTSEDLVRSLHVGMGFTIIPRGLASQQKFDEDMDVGEDFFYALKAFSRGYIPLIAKSTTNYIYDVNFKGKRSDLYWRASFRRYLKSMRKKAIVRLVSWTEEETFKLSRKKLLKDVTKYLFNTLLLVTLFLIPVLVFMNLNLLATALTVRLASMFGYATYKSLKGYGFLDGIKNRIKFELYSTLLVLNLPVAYYEFTQLLHGRTSLR